MKTKTKRTTKAGGKRRNKEIKDLEVKGVRGGSSVKGGARSKVKY